MSYTSHDEHIFCILFLVLLLDIRTMLSDNESSMIAIWKTLILLTLINAFCKAKPVDTILASGINIIDFLMQHHSNSAQTFADKVLMQLSETKLMNPITPHRETSTLKIGDKFRMIFCNSLEELYRTLDGGFRISGLDNSVVRNYQPLDLPQKYLGPGYSYLMVRYSRVKIATTLKDSVLSPQAKNAISSIDGGEQDPVNAFFKQFGTHYLSSYTLGNSVYQIYVYPIERLHNIQRNMKKAEPLNVFKLKRFISPYYFEYAGPIKTSSGDKNFLDWFSSKFYSPFLLDRYLELKRNHPLLSEFRNQLDRSETLLSLDLQSLESAINNPEKRKQLHELLDNQLKLYQANM